MSRGESPRGCGGRRTGGRRRTTAPSGSDSNSAARDCAGARPRGQANLVALVAALLAITTATVLGIALADAALAGAGGSPVERRVATAVADSLVDAGSPLTDRANVVDASAADALSVAALRARYPALESRSVRVALGGEVLVEWGTPAGGTTMRRVVLVQRTQRSVIEPRFSAGNRVTLPRRTARIRIEVDPPENVTVYGVRADERTVLYSPSGLQGTYTVSVSRRETVGMRFVANDTLSRGDVTLELYPRETTKATLAVTVDA